MKRPLLITLLVTAVAGCATLAIDDSQFSLRKGSVFETATPTSFDFDGAGAGQKRIAPLAGSGMPPMISHAVDAYLPITADSNGCLACHDRSGNAAIKGQPTAAPPSHYTKDAQGRAALAGTQYNCTACHAPQAGVKPLVDNRSR